MLYVLGEILFWVALAFLLGLLVGWFLWGWRRPRPSREGSATTTAATGTDAATRAARLISTEERLAEERAVATAVEPTALELARQFTAAPPPEDERDDLKRISGVGSVLESMLHANGIFKFSQVAALTDTEIDELQERLPKFPNRIRRDRWLEQAARLRDES